MELQGRIRVACQLRAFAAGIVGVPNNALRVITLDEHHPCAWPQVTSHGGQRHGIGFGQFGANGLLQPLLKLQERVGLRGVFVEFSTFIAFAQVGNGGRKAVGHAHIVPRSIANLLYTFAA